MNKTITYEHKKVNYTVNVSTPHTDKLAIVVNNVLCDYCTQERFIDNPDDILGGAIKRYNIEKKFKLIRQ